MKCWDALLNDDSSALKEAIDYGVYTFSVCASVLMVLLESWLWKSSGVCCVFDSESQKEEEETAVSEEETTDHMQGCWSPQCCTRKRQSFFLNFAEILRSQANFKQNISHLSDVWCEKLTTILQQALQHQHIIVRVKGSVEKDTHAWDSDVDVFIDTHGRSVSRQEKEVELLQKSDGFHQSHVKLKKLVIGCIVHNVEVDLVFSDTKEYGQLPGNFAQQFESNRPAQNAAQVLKLYFSKSSSYRLRKSHHSFWKYWYSILRTTV